MKHRHHHPCPTGKVRFPDHQAAVDALHKAQTARNFADQDGVPCSRREVRSYECTQCKGWHLTSRATPPQSRPA